MRRTALSMGRLFNDCRGAARPTSARARSIESWSSYELSTQPLEFSAEALRRLRHENDPRGQLRYLPTLLLRCALPSSFENPPTKRSIGIRICSNEALEMVRCTRGCQTLPVFCANRLLGRSRPGADDDQIAQDVARFFARLFLVTAHWTTTHRRNGSATTDAQCHHLILVWLAAATSKV
jgi:hypothetical protein